MYEAVDGEDANEIPSIYGTPMPPPESPLPAAPTFQAQAPTVNADAPFFERAVNAEGRLTFRGISLAEAEAVMSRGGQVFKRPDRAEPGQDIYEALPSSGDLYGDPSKSGHDAGDLYSVPIKKRGNAAPPPPAGTNSAVSSAVGCI
jgi:hypothetical protein